MSKATIASYSPEDVSVSIAGVISLKGFVEGTFVSINRDTPLFQTHESSDGMVSRVKRNSKTYTVNVMLMNTSESNEILTRLSLLDHTTHIVKFPLLIKDALGGTVFFSTSSWIESLPATSYSTSVTERSWTIRCSQANLYVSGNEEQSSDMEDLINTIVGLAPSFSRLF